MTIQEIYDYAKERSAFEHVVKTTDGLAVACEPNINSITLFVPDENTHILGGVNWTVLLLQDTYQHPRVSDALIRVYKDPKADVWVVMNYDSNSFGVFVYEPTQEDIFG